MTLHVRDAGWFPAGGLCPLLGCQGAMSWGEEEGRGGSSIPEGAESGGGQAGAVCAPHPPRSLWR